ncbi:MAG TPA: adenylate/guanylate cyclase domain-containing protein [Acidimicrobiales bacterium]|nr:adenylate/guanylate cyclase domain-containing protein [Acidimicrobiales bacterium]
MNPDKTAPPGEPESARDLGAAAVETLRRNLARKAASLIRRDPDAADVALELGLVDRTWLDNPDKAPISTTGPYEVLERFWERAVEQRPSRLAAFGLGAAQLLAGRLAPPSGRPESLAVVFTDLEGFTGYTAEYGDEAALTLLKEHHRDAGPIVRREGGRIVKRLGDGLLCTFGSAQGGLRAAVGLLGTAPGPLRLRAGVHVGEAIVSSDDVIGHAVNVAARVAETAGGGMVMATQEAVDAAGPTRGVRVKGKPRARRFKGIAERVVVLEVEPDLS